MLLNGKKMYCYTIRSKKQHTLTGIGLRRVIMAHRAEVKLVDVETSASVHRRNESKLKQILIMRPLDTGLQKSHYLNVTGQYR